MIFRLVSPSQFKNLTDWAESNNVDYDVWNAEDAILGTTNKIELGLKEWPENWEDVAKSNNILDSKDTP